MSWWTRSSTGSERWVSNTSHTHGSVGYTTYEVYDYPANMHGQYSNDGKMYIVGVYKQKIKGVALGYTLLTILHICLFGCIPT